MNDEHQKLLYMVHHLLDQADAKLTIRLHEKLSDPVVEARGHINQATGILRDLNFDCAHCEGTGKTRLLDLEIP